MLSDTLNKNVDALDALSEQMQDEIDSAIASIDIKALMYDPEYTLLEVIEILKKTLSEKYIPEAMLVGKNLSREILEDDIVVDLSTNPNENKNV